MLQKWRAHVGLEEIPVCPSKINFSSVTSFTLLGLYLHENFESIQRSCTGARHRASSTSRHQMAPPHPCLLLLCRELIRHHQTLPYIKYLQGEASRNVRTQQKPEYTRRRLLQVALMERRTFKMEWTSRQIIAQHC